MDSTGNTQRTEVTRCSQQSLVDCATFHPLRGDGRWALARQAEYRANFRFLSSRFFHFSDEEKPTERNRLAIWSMFLEKPTGWRYRFFLSKNSKPGQYTLSHARTSTIPYRRAWWGTSGGSAPPGTSPWAGRGRSLALRLVVWWVIAQQAVTKLRSSSIIKGRQFFRRRR